MRFILFILLCCVIAAFCSCSKGWEDIQIPEQEKRVYIVSKRFTDPPALNPNGTWKPYKTVRVTLSAGVDYRAYVGLKPDTLISSCSIDKVDSAFKIEIRSYSIE